MTDVSPVRSHLTRVERHASAVRADVVINNVNEVGSLWAAPALAKKITIADVITQLEIASISPLPLRMYYA